MVAGCVFMSFFWSKMVAGSILVAYLIAMGWGWSCVFTGTLGESLTSDWLMEDSLSSLMLFLLVFVVISSFLCSDKDYNSDKDLRDFGIMMSVIGFVCVSFFMVSSLFLFYFLFESSLVPTLVLILIWGYQPERLQAGFYMMLYTVSASMPLFVSLCWLSPQLGSDNMVELKLTFTGGLSSLMWVFMIIAFLVKLPVFFVHGWLPKAHVEAPVSGSMILAGILLKLGGYGLYRFFYVLGFHAEFMGQMLLTVSLWGGLLCSMMCLSQSDMKGLIAYSSVSHMSLILGGLLSFFCIGWMSGICLMFAHGLCSPSLFALANNTYSFYGSRSVMLCRGMLKIFPSLTFLWFVLSVLNMSCPPSLNFLSELLLMASMLFLCLDYTFVVGLMCFVSAGYCLFLYCNVNHGGGSHSMYLLAYAVITGRSLFPIATCGLVLVLMVTIVDLTLIS